jgi:arylsulfatase A-like enzyme/chitodextrinase
MFTGRKKLSSRVSIIVTFFLVSLGFLVIQEVYAQSSPVAHWAFDDGSGTTASDSSGNGYHGTLLNGPVWTAGQVGGGLSFDGIDDLVSTPYSGDHPQLSLEVWIYPTGGTNWGRLVENHGEFELTFEEAGRKIVFGQRFAPNWGYWRTADNVIPLNTWTHVAVTYDRGSTSNDPVIYLNGVAQSITETYIPSGNVVYSNSSYNLGGMSRSNRGIHGVLDQVKVFDSVLSAAEVLADYNTDLGPDTTPPSMPSNLIATAVSSSQIDLTWDASSDNIAVSGYNIFRDGSFVVTVAGTTYQDAGLSPDTTYIYTVSALDAAGNESGQSQPASATTFFIDTTPPSDPTNLVASTVSSSQIDLAWNASTDNVAVSGYNIFRDGSFLVTVAGTTYQDAGLSPDTTYTYTVSALDAAGNESGQSQPASATTLSIDTTPPTIPANLTATTLSASQIALAWDAASDNLGVAGYNVYRDSLVIAVTTDLFFNDSGLNPGTSYTYNVSAFDAAGNESGQSQPATAVTSANPPSGLWRLDDGSGTTASDSSGNGYHGTLLNGPVWSTGKINGGLSFDGLNDYIDTNYLGTPNEISLIAWIYPSSAGNQWERIFQKTLDFELIFESVNNKIVFGQRFSSNWGYWRTVDNVIPDNAWSHIALTYDRTSTSNDPVIYINGVQQTLTETSIPSGNLATSSNTLTMGGMPSPNHTVNGILDELKFYEVVLTNSEVLVDFNSGGGSNDTIPPTVSISSLATGSIVSHQMILAADATDNAGLAGVQFKIDGTNWGAEDTTSPYSISVDTTQLTDGLHVLEAEARDIAGLTTVSSPVTVTVDNTNPRMNIVLIMTDDQRYDVMQYMPLTTGLFNNAGVKFDNATVTSPICCPSRASFLTGQYAHNHGVLQNQLPNGGATVFDDKSTLATWLDSAGYETGLFGKYLNDTDLLGSYVPPGWDEWHVFAHQNGMFYNYNLNENGTLVGYGNSAADYSTDVLTNKAVQFINSTSPDQPFFLFLSLYAPHEPFTPAQQDVGSYSNWPDWRPPAFNEADVSDKPTWVQNLPIRSSSQIVNNDANHRDSLESLQSVDRSVETIFNTLSNAGRLDDTMIVFVSDNGLSWGEHRWFDDKNCVYEECIRVPLWVYQSNLPERSDSSLIQNIDVPITFADLAQVVPTNAVNGTSFIDLLNDASTSWRPESLIETLGLAPERNYQAVRTSQYLYAEYENGDREFYDLSADPDQLINVVSDPGYTSVISVLQSALNSLRNQ